MANPVPVSYSSPVQKVGGGREIFPNASLDLIAAAPENSWVKLNATTYQSVWPENDYRAPYGSGVSGPSTIILAWSGFAWDSKRSRLLLWGGGHANSSGNELFAWDASTRQWSLALYPSDVISVSGGGAHDTVDGARHSPLSSHTYASNQYLPTIDRMVVFGGAAHSTGGAMVLRDPPGAATSLRNVGCYTLQPALLGQGFVGGLPGSNPHRNTTLGVDLPGARAWEMRDWMAPDAQAFVGFGARTNSGVDVRKEAGADVAYALFASNAWRISFAEDWRNDAITKVGRYWAETQDTLRAVAIHNAANLFVSTGNATKPLTFWDLDYAGAGNNDKSVLAANLGGAGASSFLSEDIRKAGMAYDPVRNRLLAWLDGGRIYEITVPTGKPTPTTGWTVTVLVDPASTRPQTPAEMGANASSGVTGKWRYAPDLDAFIGLQHKTDGNVWAFKPAQWQDPRAAA